MTNILHPKRRDSKIVVQQAKDELLIYDLDTNRASCLNPTSLAIWEACDGDTTTQEIADKLESKLGAKVEIELVWLGIEQLAKSKLLENGDEISNPFKSQSRRKLIQKIGFASLVSLPIISSLVAPRAANAMSVCFVPLAAGCPCATNGSCDSGCCGTAGGMDMCVDPTNQDDQGVACRANCECMAGMTCRAITGFPRQCVFPLSSLPDGSICVHPNECVSGACPAGVCLVSAGNPCVVGADCASGICNVGFCA